MYETIAYIPTAMAYVFVVLLVLILGFIVIYISHKLYTYIYDYMPVPQISAASLQRKFRTRRIRRSSSNYDNINEVLDSQIQWKPRSAFRILISVRPCYLASVVYEIDHQRQNDGSSAMTNPISNKVQRMTKYFDSLSVIPPEPHILHCYNDGSPTITYLASGDVMIES